MSNEGKYEVVVEGQDPLRPTFLRASQHVVTEQGQLELTTVDGESVLTAAPGRWVSVRRIVPLKQLTSNPEGCEDHYSSMIYLGDDDTKVNNMHKMYIFSPKNSFASDKNFCSFVDEMNSYAITAFKVISRKLNTGGQ